MNRIALLLALGLLCAGVGQAQVEIRIRSDYEAGTRAYRNGDLKMAIVFFRQGTEKGDPRSEFALATHYAFGEGVEEDFTRARTLLESSAGKGYPPANTMLGIMYQRAKGVPADAAKAAEYFRKAALGCEPQAQTLLARALFAGDGVAQNRPESLAWLMLASDQGDKEAWQGVEAVGARLSAGEQAEAKNLYQSRKAQLDCKKPPGQ
jgi:TPR repeat protein